MAVYESKYLTLVHPQTERGQQLATDLVAMWEQRDKFLFHRELEAGDRFFTTNRRGERIERAVGGSVQVREYRKTMNYSREERRQARKKRRELEPNNLLPAGMRIVPANPDDPTL